MSWMSVFSAGKKGFDFANSIGFFAPLFREIGYHLNNSFTNALPDPETAWDAYVQGLIPGGDFERLCNFHGIYGPPMAPGAVGGNTTQRAWRAVWESKRKPYSPEEIERLYRSGGISRDKRWEMMKRAGLWNADDINDTESFYTVQTPDASQVTHWAVREAFDNRIAARFGYDQERPEIFDQLLAQSGWGGTFRLPNEGEPPADRPSWGQLIWRSHWQIISPSQAYEMYQRLRPDRVRRYPVGDRFPEPFTADDLRTVLRIADYPTVFRDQLAAVAYRKPRLVDIDRFFRTGQITASEATELHLDLGYSPADAEMRVRWLQIEAIGKPVDPFARRLMRQAIDLYSSGVASRESTKENLVRLISNGRLPFADGHVLDQDDANYRRLVESRAEQRIESVDWQSKIDRQKKMVRVWRSRFFKGIATEWQIRDDARAVGLQQDWIDNFIEDLKLELAGGRLLLSTQQIRTLAIDGVLTVERAAEYLGNLGWKRPELDYLLTQLKGDLAMQAAQEAERLASDRASAERARLRQLRAAEAAQDKAVRRLTRNASDAQLHKYYVRGIISEDQLAKNLRERRIDEENIQRRLRLARQDREAYLAKQARRAGTAASQGQGQAGSGGSSQNQPQLQEEQTASPGGGR